MMEDIRIDKVLSDVVGIFYPDGKLEIGRLNSDMTKELVRDHVLSAGNQNLRLNPGDLKTHPADSPFYDKNFRDNDKN